MKRRSLLLLRVSLGLLMLIWGVDKLVNVEHGLTVSEHFYLGAFSSAALLQTFGAIQIALGALVLLGVARRYAYPLLDVPATDRAFILDTLATRDAATLAHLFFHLHFYLVRRSGEWIHDGSL